MAGRIPQEFIDELLNRVDLVEVIDTRVPLRKAGRDYMACCPFHNEKTPSFTVSPTKQFYHCFGCGAHGNAIGFLLEYEHMEFVDAVEDLARRVGLTVPRSAAAAGGEGRPDLYGLLEQAAAFFRGALESHPDAARAREYLVGRGLSAEVTGAYGLGYAPPGWDGVLKALGENPSQRQRLQDVGLVVGKAGGGAYDRFRDRVMFPIRDRRGRVIGFGGRVLGDGTPKYLNSPESQVFHKGRELYGLYEAQQALRRLSRLLVVEGYMDVIALSQYGLQYAVATLGTATTHDHLERMFRVVSEVVFCFDGDRAGRQAAWRALEASLPVVRDGRQVSFLFLPDGEDPDTMVRKEGRAAFEQRLVHSVPLSRFLYEELAARADTTSMDGRARLVELARPLIARVPEGVYRELLVDGLAEVVRVEPRQLRGWLSPGAAPPAAPQSGTRRGPAGLRAPSPVRHAVVLLLQRPALAQEAGEPKRLERSDRAGITLLVRLLELLQAHPHLNTAAILERWRGTEDGGHLERLAALPLAVPEAGIAQEFQDTLVFLVSECTARARDSRWASLARKRPSEWSEEEKREARQLLPGAPDDGAGDP
ncbi:MAG: DNA primase [Chromatiales bacterium 21-64-14]|nr:MAG: DNA primase [Chromatiales bacterium 21-64-14]HQU17199.1 DNA primase [Gammaproteobacteria bacterium]